MPHGEWPGKTPLHAWLVGFWALLLLLQVAACTTPESSPIAELTGQVLSLAGEPVAHAEIVTPEDTAISQADGRFSLTIGHAQWASVRADGFVPMTKAASPGEEWLVRLTPASDSTIVLKFVGDMMFGRRFFDPRQSGSTENGLLSPSSGPAEHLELLSSIRPLIENADITIGNLESPLVEDPYFDPVKPTPSRFHQTKDYVLASAHGAAIALREAGFDVLGLGNNHLFDVLDEGLTSTLNVLQAAGFHDTSGYFGSGQTIRDAWKPAVQTVNGQTIAFIGCTTILGEEHALSYVATETKAGAAGCTPEYIEAAVSDAAARYQTVVFMLHGGYEYGRDPSPQIRRLSYLARKAGADLVVNHHPHVVGGFEANGSGLIAWTMGNFVFDQTVWPTFESYVLTVHLHAGRLIRAYIDPIIVEGYSPKGVSGRLADFVARGAAGREPGPFSLFGGRMEVEFDAVSSLEQETKAFRPDVGVLYELEAGWYVTGAEDTTSLRLGRDLLWTGSFEDGEIMDIVRDGALWNEEAPGRVYGPFGYAGSKGARLQRVSRNDSAVVLTPLHRVLVVPGSEFTVTGLVRGNVEPGPIAGRADLTLQVSWYDSTAGPSFDRQLVPLTLHKEGNWASFLYPFVVPEDAVAVGLYFRLEPPARGLATAAFDDIRVIEWALSGTRPGPLFTHFAIERSTAMTLGRRIWPGVSNRNDGPMARDIAH